jgi:hypothetical protein
VIEDFYTVDDPAHYTHVSVRTYLPPDRVRTIAGPKDSRSDKKYEEIRIGTISYSRDNGGEWKVKESGFSGLYVCESMIRTPSQTGSKTGTGESSGPAEISSEREFRFLGHHQVNGQKTELFQQTEKITFKTSSFETETTTISKHWVTEAGLLLKREAIQRSSGSTRWSRKAAEYDYSPGEIKIEAPIP